MCNTLTCPVEGIDAGASPALTTDANYRPIIAYVERTVVSTVGSCSRYEYDCHRALSVPSSCTATAPRGHRHGFCAFRFGLFESFSTTGYRRRTRRVIGITDQDTPHTHRTP